MTTETMPEILTARHIAEYLQISRRRVYELFQLKPEAGGIPNFSLGFTKKCSKRAKKQDFLDWIEARSQGKRQSPLRVAR